MGRQERSAHLADNTALEEELALEGGALSRGEQISLLTLAVLIYMWAFITCVGTEQRRLQMKNLFFFQHCIHLERFCCAVILL